MSTIRRSYNNSETPPAVFEEPIELTSDRPWATEEFPEGKVRIYEMGRPPHLECSNEDLGISMTFFGDRPEAARFQGGESSAIAIWAETPEGVMLEGGHRWRARPGHDRMLVLLG